MTAEEPVDRLRELIAERRIELGGRHGALSLRDMARRAEGYASLETLRLLAQGRGGRHRGRITDRVAEGLARALQLPVSRIYEAAGVQPPGTRWEWPRRFDRLGPAHRELIEDMVAALLGQYDAGFRDALKGDVPPSPDTPTDDETDDTP